MKKKKALQITWCTNRRNHQLMNNNIDTIDLEDELFEHFRFEVPKGKSFN
jgi:hypothetical protein